MQFINTEQHRGTGLLVEPFGTDGAQRLVPLDGLEAGRPFILDAPAVAELAAYLTTCCKDD